MSNQSDHSSFLILALMQCMKAAHQDPLLGIPNRAAWQARLQRRSEVVPARGLLIIDVDFFKEMNSEYGHSGADLKYQELARRLRTAIRPEDTFLTPRARQVWNGDVYRIGGDELAVVLDHVNESELRSIAERLLEVVHNAEIQHAGSPFGRVTVSIGGVWVPDEQWDFSAAYSQADKLLFDVKNRGRNGALVGSFESCDESQP